MKRILPVIILLITASLIGIIIIQISWINNMLVVKEEQLAFKVVKAMAQVGDELMEQKSALPNLHNPKFRPSFMLPSDQLLSELMKPSTIARNFTAFEIEEKLRKAFDANGIKDTRFEFAIASSVNLVSYEIKSKNFLNVVDDTVLNRTFIYILPVPSGSDYESLVPDERMMVIVPNVKHIVFNQLRWMISGAVLFTLILCAAFYVTVSALLRQKKMSEIKNDFIN
ncbi:MAG TPA: sensor histidine kinase, partial [Chitinophagaceae bacterium]